MSSDNTQVTIVLDRSEALVLFEWIAANEQAKAHREPNNSAEGRVIWRIEGQLESLLPEVFMPGYALLVEAARMDVLNKSI